MRSPVFPALEGRRYRRSARQGLYLPDGGGVIPPRSLLTENGRMIGTEDGLHHLITQEHGEAFAHAALVAQWDATLSDSHPGTGSTFLNIVNTPADGASKAAYDLALTNFTFIGTANTVDAYLRGNGSAFATIAANTPFLRDMHKTTGGSDYTFAIAYWLNTTTASNLFSTQTSASNHGLGLEINTNTTHRQRGNTASATVTSAGGTQVAQQWYLTIISHSHSGNASRRWINTRINTQQGHAFNTSTTNASRVMTLFARTNAVAFVSNQSRLRGAMLLNTYADDTLAGQIVDYYNNLHWHQYA